MRKAFFMTGFILLVNLILNAQSNAVPCTDLQNGTFYFYPKNSSAQFFSVREGDLQTETDIASGDTTVWKVRWMNDCQYSLAFTSGAKSASKETIDVLKKHKLIYQIKNTGPDYYVFTGHIDKVSNMAFQTDTMWLHEKATVANNELFKYIENSSIKKAHFSDTSTYALLYVYRPKKMTNSLGNYLIYCNDNILCLAQNNSGYLFKILKEGNLHLSSRLFKDESSIDLNIKFGKKYYAKSMIHWGVFKRLYNFKLEMAVVDAITGQEEFNGVESR